MWPAVLLALAACGAPSTAPDSATTKGVANVKLVPHASITSGALQVCNASGHVRLRYDAAADGFRFYPDPPRTGKFDSVSRGSRAWSVGESAWTGDMSQALTIHGRLRDEKPALWAKTSVAPSLWLDTTGIDRAQLDSVIDRLDTSAGADHVLGAFHLHLPSPMVFEAASLAGPNETYGARFAQKSQWVQSKPAQDFAGAKFWWVAHQLGTNDHTGEPRIPAWHGEAAIGGLVLEIDATGTAATEARFLDFARLSIEAALVDPSAACRARVGHMGT